ncbi:4a-hydroxytetrahydrobiopterin dehydratase [uncultured Thiodictyon sp.]|uniref:4a-hydroxytetrahydrobiopterin dehydratase n=1 Tax=uncultured Thiodictyon sp. TaxID=1846217 RepID=UPI0025CEA6C9|nr:4a-hydroxytetrahydrobiopterin dehydratase [uncultured Thiodictyon sp.]
MSDEKVYDASQIQARIAADLPHWYYEDGKLGRKYRTGGWKSTLMVVNTVGHLAEAAWHHPELAVAYDSVLVKLSTHSANGLTDKDFELAQRIEETLTWRPGAGSALAGTPDDPRFTYIKYD